VIVVDYLKQGKPLLLQIDKINLTEKAKAVLKRAKRVDGLSVVLD
jgi:hypothetical protein